MKLNWANRTIYVNNVRYSGKYYAFNVLFNNNLRCEITKSNFDTHFYKYNNTKECLSYQYYSGIMCCSTKKFSKLEESYHHTKSVKSIQRKFRKYRAKKCIYELHKKKNGIIRRLPIEIIWIILNYLK
jgi:hypothetical protein